MSDEVHRVASLLSPHVKGRWVVTWEVKRNKGRKEGRMFANKEREGVTG